MIHSLALTFNPFQENTYLIWTDNKKAVIVDPGCFGRDEETILVQHVEAHDLTLEAIWLTHAHIDHILGLDFCLRKWNLPFFIHEMEMNGFRATEVYAPNYGFQSFRLPVQAPIFYEEMEISLENERFKILFVPGHSSGHVAFYHPHSSQIWAGDVLFRQSIGRTDLPGGNFEVLSQSIINQLYTLHQGTVVFPGHGPSTEIGFEMKFNPFVSLP
jgi:glyoxylase-like metal-dependent hydrolase (beta-lactamase superfamily II)